MYRELIGTFRSHYRCVAPDHVGFGLSAKPRLWNYRPWSHAINIKHLIQTLDLSAFHLVAHDWGGPIGLSVVLDQPDRLCSLTLLNTWMWGLSNRLTARLFSGFFGSLPGRYLIEEWNFFVNVLMKWGVFQSKSLPEDVHERYRHPFEGDASKKGVWRFAKDLIDADDWLTELWDRRDKLPRVPVLIQWGMRDPAFTESELQRWTHFLSEAEVYRFEEASHYVLEEEGESITQNMKNFLDNKT